jgi:taurine dioxygenase
MPTSTSHQMNKESAMKSLMEESTTVQPAAPWSALVGATRPATPARQIGAELTDIDIRELTESEVASIKQRLYEHKLVVIRRQFPSDEEYIAFARRLGTPQIYLQPNYHHPDHKEIFVSSNEQHQGRKFGVRGTGRYWHTDYSFMPEPLPLTMLRAKTLPRGVRETYYIDTSQVLERLPPEVRSQLEGRFAIHEGKYRYKVQASDVDVSLAELLEMATALAPPVRHPCVIEHPVTGARCLYVNRGFTTAIEGLSVEESTRILTDLFEFLERPEHIHTHSWDEGDIVLWDNRYLVHRAGVVAAGDTSTTYRIGIYDGLPFYVGLAPSKSQPVLVEADVVHFPVTAAEATP